ncbi:MAG: type II toxin-antitoxin system prevent-host-death family antitoxin [Chloroflexi bacterium]|nr:type II toxin-antitoxin system prevent-host-death family antitoxin [Chloroflexota bacterium]
MPQIAVDDLEKDASEIIRTVQEERVEYVITDHGQPVAVISPLAKQETSIGSTAMHHNGESLDEYWRQWDELAAEIDANWKSDKTAVELIEEQRREL